MEDRLLGKIEDEKGIYEFHASHFVLRCKCGSIDYTFKHQRHLFRMMLTLDKDLIIVCKTEFPFNLKSYEALEHRAMTEKLSKT
jgi:hypothetical protein